MITSRRGFLKALGAVGVVKSLPEVNEVSLKEKSYWFKFNWDKCGEISCVGIFEQDAFTKDETIIPTYDVDAYGELSLYILSDSVENAEQMASEWRMKNKQLRGYMLFSS